MRSQPASFRRGLLYQAVVDVCTACKRCYHPIVPVFKHQSGDRIHVRTPVMLGVIVLLVVLLSAFCYYRVASSLP